MFYGSKMSAQGLFCNYPFVRSQGMRAMMAFCLLFAVVQPWNLPIPGLEKPAMTEVTQSGLGLPANEEEKVDEKVQTNAGPILFRTDRLLSLIPCETRNIFPSSPFFEVPTPPPRG